MKRALHFGTKLKGYSKMYFVWVPPYDLFTSARKALFPAPTATGVHRLETLRSRFGHFTANDKLRLRLTVLRYPSAHVWDLRFAGGSSRLLC